MFKLILILSSLHSNAMVDLNAGDWYGQGWRYFSTQQLCEQVGERWKHGHTSYEYVCLDVSGQ